MNKLWTAFMVLAFALALPACKGKVKDTDIQAAAETALAANPELSGLAVSVKDGIATLSGEALNPATLATAENVVKALKGVKSFVNNATIAAPPPPVPPVADADALSQAVADALKDYPTVKGTVTDQVLKLTGEIKRDRLQTLMMSLNALKSAGLKSIDSKDLIKK